jgi:hypothetical protein
MELAMTSQRNRNAEEFVSQAESFLREFESTIASFKARAKAMGAAHGEPADFESMCEREKPLTREAHALLALNSIEEDGELFITTGARIPSQAELEADWYADKLADLRAATARMPQGRAEVN